MDKEAESRALAIEALRTAPPSSLFSSPLDYIFADHFRLRTLYRFLDEMAEETEPDPVKVAVTLKFMTVDSRLHTLDEEEDLFPLLRCRGVPQDSVDSMLGQLGGEHVENMIDAERVVERLTATLTGIDCKDSGFRNLLKRFAANGRRRVTMENAIVLPFARAHLNEDDLRKLGRSMAARRNLEYTERDQTVSRVRPRKSHSFLLRE